MKVFWVIDMIIPISMILIGIYYRKKSTTDITPKSGFRTRASMSSKEAWSYAHRTASKTLIITGILLFIFVLLIKNIVPLASEYLSLINNSVSIIGYICVSIYVQMKVQSRFNQ